MNNLHYYRCAGCLEASTSEELLPEIPPPQGRTHHRKAPWIAAKCGICEQHVQYLGFVVENKRKLAIEEHRSACNGLCTGAVGPLCICKCLCENHGTGRAVTIRREGEEIPILDYSSQFHIKATMRWLEYKSALEQATALFFNTPNSGKPFRLVERAKNSSNHQHRMKLLAQFANLLDADLRPVAEVIESDNRPPETIPEDYYTYA